MDSATVKQLRSLAAVAQHGSVTAAARAMHVSPPAVGQQIRLLERAAGIDLVTRTPQGLRLTAAGEQVIQTAHNIEIELRSCEANLDALRSGTAGRVALGAVSTAKYFAPHLLAPFQAAHPGIDVSLHIGNRREIIDALGGLDVDIFIMGRPPDGFELITHEIGQHPHVVVAHPGHRLAGARSIEAAALVDETFLMREDGSGTRMLAERLLADLAHTPHVGMEISSNETIKQAVMAGLGLALLSWHTVAHEVGEGRLVVLDIVGTPVMRHWFVLRHAHAVPTPAMTILWNFIVDHAGRFLPAL